MTTPAAPVPVKRRRRKISREDFATLYTEKCREKTHVEAAAALGLAPATYNKYLLDLEQHSPGIVRRQPVGPRRIFTAAEFQEAYHSKQLYKLPHYKAAAVMGISHGTYDRYLAEMRKARPAN